MDWRTLIPMIINVVAHVFDQLGNEMRGKWFVLASFNRDTARPIISGIRTNTG